MKKTLALTLCLLLLLTFFSGCSSQNPQAVQVGFGRADITPETPVPLGGYSDPESRLSGEVNHRLYATCIAFTDKNGTTVLLFHMDILNCSTGALLGRKAVSKATEVPYNQIMVAATHTHSAPLNGYDEEYDAYMQDQMVAAAQAALADRTTVTQISTATAYPETLNYVRHYVMNDGSIVGDNFGDTRGKTYVGHVHDADNAMQLIKITRETGKDILLMNWQGHPHRDGGSTNRTVSADIIGVIRDELEGTLDCQFAYFTGASGNVNNKSRIASEQITKNCEEHGKALAQYALNVTEYTEQEIGSVQFITRYFKINTTHELVTMDLPMSVFSIGDVSFIIAPYEMFDTNGIAIKEGSPYNMTFIVTCANGAFGYVPSLPTYEYGGYEVNSCSLAKGSGETLADEYVNMLTELFDTRK